MRWDEMKKENEAKLNEHTTLRDGGLEMGMRRYI